MGRSPVAISVFEENDGVVAPGAVVFKNIDTVFDL